MPVLRRPRAGHLVWDPATETWVGGGNPSAYGRIAQQEATRVADAFWGGLILGVASVGVLWTAVMALAFSTS